MGFKDTWKDKVNGVDVVDAADINSIAQAVIEQETATPDWAKQPNKPSYTASEVGALPASTKIPTKTSELENDSGFITKAVSDLENYYKKSEVYSKDEIDKKGFLTEHQDISGKLDASKLPEAVNAALAQAKESGEFDGADGKSAYDYAKDGGYTGTEAEFAEDSNPDNIKAELGQIEAPKIVSSVDEMTDTSKHYINQTTGTIWASRTVITGGEVVKTPNFTNLFDKSKVSLNAYITGSDIGTEDGSFITNIMPFDKANLAKPQVIRIANFPKALTAHKRSRIAFLPDGAYNGNTFCQFNSLLSGITVDTSNLALQTITVADGGTINSGSALTNKINSIQISLRLGATALTLDDVPDLIITVNEEITYTETTTPIETFTEWYDTGISYAPTFNTDLVGVLGENNVIYLSDNLPSGTYTLKYPDDNYATVGTISK